MSENDAVIVCAGGILPTPFLKGLGVMVETHHGTVRVYDISVADGSM